MDHEFCYDETGELVVRLDMGQEITALWLNTEIFPRQDMTQALQELIEDIQSGRIRDKTLTTPRFSVLFSDGEVSIERLTDANDDDWDEDSQLTSMELTSGCGLDDLKAVVDSWMQFRY